MYTPYSRNQGFYRMPSIHNNQWNSFNYPYQSPSYLFQERTNGIGQPPWSPFINPYAGGFPYPYGNPYFTQPQQGEFQQQQSIQSTNNSSNEPTYSDLVFQNPLLSDEQAPSYNNPMYQNQEPYFHPYPKASFLAKPPSSVQNVLNSFKSQDGSLDIPKMVDTAGQMINAVSQVSSVVKGIGGIFKV
ncbi:YppG family protein [Niallia sp. XMNu-256]|uniref:YppG family protein n=1 Tax=Niallia sp. XMNu-256 TaxID=3082444 RepID=UPI0030D3D8B2